MRNCWYAAGTFYFFSGGNFSIYLTNLRLPDVTTALFPGRVSKAQISITLKAGASFSTAVAAKQKDTEEKKRIRAEIEAGREKAHEIFKKMTTKA